MCQLLAIFKQSTKRSIEALYESFGLNYGTYAEFERYLMENTENHQFIFYDFNSQDPYKIMRAPNNIPNFMLKFNTKIK